MIKSNSAGRALYYALCLCVSPLLVAQQASQSSLPHAVRAVPPTQDTSKASDTISVYPNIPTCTQPGGPSPGATGQLCLGAQGRPYPLYGIKRLFP